MLGYLHAELEIIGVDLIPQTRLLNPSGITYFN